MCLLLYRRHQFRVRMAERGHADAGGKIEVLIAFVIVYQCTLSAYRDQISPALQSDAILFFDGAVIDHWIWLPAPASASLTGCSPRPSAMMTRVLPL